MPPKHFQSFPTAANILNHDFERRNSAYQAQPIPAEPKNLVEYQSCVAQQWAGAFVPSIQEAVRLVLASIMPQVKDRHEAHVMRSVNEAIASRLPDTGSLISRRDIEELVHEGHKKLVLEIQHAIAETAAVGTAVTAPDEKPADAVEVNAGECNTSVRNEEKLVQIVEKLVEEFTSLRKEVKSLQQGHMEASKPSSKGSRPLKRQQSGGKNISGPVTRSRSRSQRQKALPGRRKSR